MTKFNKLEMDMLEKVADLHEIPVGAYNIRNNGFAAARQSSANIEIMSKPDCDGIDVFIKPGTVNESVHIPVIIMETGVKECVYNDFHIGHDSDVVIIAGCGIHNCGDQESQHDGIHRFFIGKNAKVKYIEKHYGDGDGRGERTMNPTTVIEMNENSYMEMETVQIKGIDSTQRNTKATLKDGAILVIGEKIFTHGTQYAGTEFEVDLQGEHSSAHVISRSVATEDSHQDFVSKVYGNNLCSGHTECDAIIMDNGKVTAVPEIKANHPDATLIHEATIGKIAGEQLIKLMTLGLTEKEAEEQIVTGFLK